MVKKVYFKGVKFSGYSNWHRQQHNCLGFSDIDQVSTCNACSKPLFLAETVFNNEWQKALMHLLNKPSKNKTILNLGLYKNNHYGIFLSVVYVEIKFFADSL